MLAGMAVSAAEPSGVLGALKEAIASGSTLARAKSDAGANEPSKPSSQISRPRRGEPQFRKHCANNLPEPRSPGMLFNVRSLT
jgi:hypothetical protein